MAGNDLIGADADFEENWLTINGNPHGLLALNAGEERHFSFNEPLFEFLPSPTSNTDSNFSAQSSVAASNSTVAPLQSSNGLVAGNTYSNFSAQSSVAASYSTVAPLQSSNSFVAGNTYSNFSAQSSVEASTSTVAPLQSSNGLVAGNTYSNSNSSRPLEDENLPVSRKRAQNKKTSKRKQGPSVKLADWPNWLKLIEDKSTEMYTWFTTFGKKTKSMKQYFSDIQSNHPYLIDALKAKKIYLELDKHDSDWGLYFRSPDSNALSIYSEAIDVLSDKDNTHSNSNSSNQLEDATLTVNSNTASKKKTTEKKSCKNNKPPLRFKELFKGFESVGDRFAEIKLWFSTFDRDYTQLERHFRNMKCKHPYFIETLEEKNISLKFCRYENNSKYKNNRKFENKWGYYLESKDSNALQILRDVLKATAFVKDKAVVQENLAVMSATTDSLHSDSRKRKKSSSDEDNNEAGDAVHLSKRTKRASTTPAAVNALSQSANRFFATPQPLPQSSSANTIDDYALPGFNSVE